MLVETEITDIVKELQDQRPRRAVSGWRRSSDNRDIVLSSSAVEGLIRVRDP
jgi:hypothetical protein